MLGDVLPRGLIIMGALRLGPIMMWDVFFRAHQDGE